MNQQRLRNWCFTSYRDPTAANLEQQNTVRYCIWQQERCPATGRLHYQGYVEFNVAYRMAQVKTVFADNTLHLEARKGTRDQARDYCRKEDTRVPDTEPVEIGEFGLERGKRTDLVEARQKILTHTSWQAVLDDESLVSVVARHRTWAREIYETRPRNVEQEQLRMYTWEKEVEDLLKEDVKKRRVIWIWSAESGTGKSTFFDYISATHNVLPGGDYLNTLYAYDDHPIIWFDLTRAQTHEHIPYHAIEKLSNGGYHLSSKFHSVRKYVHAHILVNANIPPDETKLPNRCVIIAATRLYAPGSPSIQPSPELVDVEDSEVL